MSDVRDFGASGDGKTDDFDAIQHAVNEGDGWVEFPPGDYLLNKPVVVDLTKRRRIGIAGSGGGAKVLMAGSGPAFHLVGNHGGTADPETFKPTVWQQQRMPTIQNIEIEGRHAEADGIELTGTMQAIISRVAIRGARNGVHLTKRNRNTIISDCQIYHNRGGGIYLDGVNLHQINIIGNHISYNRLGGIRIERSEVRNLQITGNDIEYNTDRTHKLGDQPTAEIYVDTTAPGATVNEIAIASNTIQASPSPAGANIRIIGSDQHKDRPPGLWTIVGNVIGSQTNNVHLTRCYGVVISGNTIYSCRKYNLLIEHCRQVSVGSNIMRRHTTAAAAGMRLVDSADCVLSGCQILDEAAEGQTTGVSLLEIVRCRRINVTGCSISNPSPFGILAVDSHDLNISGCTILESRRPSRMRSAIRMEGKGTGNLISGCRVGRGREEALSFSKEAEATVAANVIDGPGD
ncbi:MAG: right-handed parallel beta-helix repeat-containing protein [Pirellulales bacterium]